MILPPGHSNRPLWEDEIPKTDRRIVLAAMFLAVAFAAYSAGPQALAPAIFVSVTYAVAYFVAARGRLTVLRGMGGFVSGALASGAVLGAYLLVFRQFGTPGWGNSVYSYAVLSAPIMPAIGVARAVWDRKQKERRQRGPASRRG